MDEEKIKNRRMKIREYDEEQKAIDGLREDLSDFTTVDEIEKTITKIQLRTNLHPSDMNSTIEGIIRRYGKPVSFKTDDCVWVELGRKQYYLDYSHLGGIYFAYALVLLGMYFSGHSKGIVNFCLMFLEYFK